MDIISKLLVAVVGGVIVKIAMSWHADRKAHQAKIEATVEESDRKLALLARDQQRQHEASIQVSLAAQLLKGAQEEITILKRDLKTAFAKCDRNADEVAMLKSEYKAELGGFLLKLNEMNNEIGNRMERGHG